jgi:hypothetical protein
MKTDFILSGAVKPKSIVLAGVSLKKATVYLTLKQMRTTSSTWL